MCLLKKKKNNVKNVQKKNYAKIKGVRAVMPMTKQMQIKINVTIMLREVNI